MFIHNFKEVETIINMTLGLKYLESFNFILYTLESKVKIIFVWWKFSAYLKSFHKLKFKLSKKNLKKLNGLANNYLNTQFIY